MATDYIETSKSHHILLRDTDETTTINIDAPLQ